MGLPLIGLPQGLRIYLAMEPVDMRKHDGLWALASQHLGLDPKGGALFVFTNKTRDRIKLLHWDGSGVWVLAKRLEQGRFSWPRGAVNVESAPLEPSPAPDPADTGAKPRTPTTDAQAADAEQKPEQKRRPRPRPNPSAQQRQNFPFFGFFR